MDSAPASPQSDPDGLTSLSLLDRVRSNDAEGWRRLVHLYSPLVYYWCRRFGLNEHDSADIMQDVFRAVYQTLDRFRRDKPTDTFRGWLWAICRHKVLDMGRAQGDDPRAIGGSEFAEKIQQIPDVEPEEIVAETQHDAAVSLVNRTLELIRGDFEPRTWTAFVQLALNGRSAREIGAQLGLSDQAVYQAKARVMRRLKQEIRDLEPNAPVSLSRR